VGDNAILYQVYSPDYAALGIPSYAPFSNKLIQSQLTTLPGNGIRVRTAQGFNIVTGRPDSASYYREYRLKDENEWLLKLNEIRAIASIIPAEMCAYDSINNRISSPDCHKHIIVGDSHLNITCQQLNGGDPYSRCN
jgi:hypothetical protein